MTSPALVPTAPSNCDPEQVQDALAAFPSGVTVVTTCADGEAYGMTVSAFCALSQDPPLVLLCVRSSGRGLDLLARSGACCVNVLSSEQAPLARLFASRRRPRGPGALDGVPHRTGTTGSPVLAGAAAHLECELEALQAWGDHTVVVGRVVAAGSAPPSAPLVVHRRRLTGVADVSAPVPPPLGVVRP